MLQTALTEEQKQAINGSLPAFKRFDVAGKIDAIIAAQLEDPGRRAVNALRLASNVASTETVTIGTDVFEVNIVNTDSTVNVSNGDLATGTPAVSGITFAAHGRSVGDLIRVENEIMKVIGVPTANKVIVRRGHSGTTKATHADATDIFVAGTPATAGRIEVGLVTTLTPAAFGAALVAVNNSEGAQQVTAEVIAAGEVAIYANQVGAVALACTETLGGTNNAWAAATMYGGKAAGQRRISMQRRAPNATEVALGNVHFVFDFVPVPITVRVVVTATPGVIKAWDGVVTVSGNRLTVDNAGSTPWAATDTIEVIVADG